RVEAWLLDAAGVCDRGLVRERNEDAMALSAVDGSGGAALVVCDGVSASADAALAARTAAEVTLAVLVATARDGAGAEAALREAVARRVAAVARAAGGDDNVTVVAATVGRVGRVG